MKFTLSNIEEFLLEEEVLKPKRKKRRKKRKPKIVRFTEEEVSAILKDIIRFERDMRIDDLDVDKKGIYAWIFSGERGPRTDHGGGEYGDDWMDDEEVYELSRYYAKKLAPKIKTIKEKLKKAGIKKNLEVYTDYGEKGHVSIIINANF